MTENKENKIFIVIPCFNEDKVICSVIKEVQAAGYQNIIVIDDGSVDETYCQAQKISSVVSLRHFLNRVKGAAVKTGIEAAKILGAEIVVTIDGDGQHNPADIQKMLKLIENGNIYL